MVIRPATCYGPGDTGSLTLLRSALSGPILAGGTRVLQFLHVGDLAELAAELVCRSDSPELVQLAGPDAMRWPAVQALVRSAFDLESGTEGSGLARFSYPYDLGRARGIGLVPRTSIREGLLALAREGLTTFSGRNGNGLP